MIRQRWLVVVALGIGGAITGESARAGQVAWLDETWTVEEWTSTYDQATAYLGFNDTHVGLSADIPVDPEFDLITDWGEFESRGHSVTATISRDFQVDGPEPGAISLLAVSYHTATIWPGMQSSFVEMGAWIQSQGTTVESLSLDNIINAGNGYGGAEALRDERLDAMLDPGRYTFRVQWNTGYRRSYSQVGGPSMWYESTLLIAGIEPPAALAAAVPEPSALRLGVIGVIGLGLTRLRRLSPALCPSSLRHAGEALRGAHVWRKKA